LIASHAAYCAFHADWPARVQQEADWMRNQGFDLVFSDVAYLPLAAAAQAGVRSIALCSLNWFDIAQAYLAEQPDMTPILQQMHAAYATADLFLQPEPSMPMPSLTRRQAIAPIAAQGCNRRTELERTLALPETVKLVLLGFGGIGYQGQGELPQLENVVWLMPDDWLMQPTAARTDLIPFSRCGLPFIDLLASCDLLITKVGYGSFVEATAHAVPVLYLDRPDWPETPYLAAWLRQHGNAAAIDAAVLFSRQVADVMHTLWRQARKPALVANGAEQAARQLMAR
jgi:UDP:flavonoid glycosyltransferase YjiC (YdhE family)